MTLVHAPAADGRIFGPYLGGRQARLAVSGLCRLLPLGYASSEAVGTRREMARLRGVDGTLLYRVEFHPGQAPRTAESTVTTDSSPIAAAVAGTEMPPPRASAVPPAAPPRAVAM